jgi:hypothetical protein
MLLPFGTLSLSLSLFFSLPLTLFARNVYLLYLFRYFMFIFYLYGQLSLSWAHLIAMLMPNGEMAQALSGLFMAVFSLFAGYSSLFILCQSLIASLK